jgi:hypothetical protein
MTTKTAASPPESRQSADTGQAHDVIAAARARNGQWLLAGLLLSGAAQLVAIAVLTSADPIPVSWWSLLLAIAPAPLAAVAAFAPRPVAKVAVVAVLAAVIAGLVGGIAHNGLFFAPALLTLIVGGWRLWRVGDREA